MPYTDSVQSGKMLLSVQIIADFMDEVSWAFLAQVQGDQGKLEGCRIFDRLEPLRPEIIYILPEGTETGFRGTNIPTLRQRISPVRHRTFAAYAVRSMRS